MIREETNRTWADSTLFLSPPFSLPQSPIITKTSYDVGNLKSHEHFECKTQGKCWPRFFGLLAHGNVILGRPSTPYNNYKFDTRYLRHFVLLLHFDYDRQAAYSSHSKSELTFTVHDFSLTFKSID